jgi:RNA polymerase sigma factor (sigma-70 family)
MAFPQTSTPLGRRPVVTSVSLNDAPVSELLSRAAMNDRQAWAELVERYQRLVWSVIRGYRLDHAAAEDVFATVWQRLVEHCDRIRDAERLPGWLATTARNESMRVLRQQRRQVPSEFEYDVADHTIAGMDEMLVDDEMQRAVLRAFARLPEEAQQLLRLLTTDPPLDYRTIAELIGKTVGYIGPTRQRLLEKLKRLMQQELEGGLS